MLRHRGVFRLQRNGDVGGAIALAIGAVSSYTFYRLKEQDDLRSWERKLLRPAGYMLVSLFFGLAGLLFTMMAFSVAQA